MFFSSSDIVGHFWGTDCLKLAFSRQFSASDPLTPAGSRERSAGAVGWRWSRVPPACSHGAAGRSIDPQISGRVSRQCPAGPQGKKKATYDFSQVADL